MTLKTLLASALSLAYRVQAWQLPPVGLQSAIGQQHAFSSVHEDDIDIVTGSQFHGLKTFANLPYLNAFSDDESKDTKFDIAILGAPCNSSFPLPLFPRASWRHYQNSKYYCRLTNWVKVDTSTSGRPGARFGPGGIRVGSQRMFSEQISIFTGQGTMNQWAKIVDVGDVGLTWFDNTIALRQLDKAHRVCIPPRGPRCKKPG